MSLAAPRLICLTPTKNESWIIRPFLAAAKYWANDVIVADQGSSDGTFEVLSNTPGITPVRNDSLVFDESHRQRLLLAEARKISGKRILIGLDADEALSANCLNSPSWSRILDASPGTIIRLRWANILPGLERAWIPEGYTHFGFVDDGSEHHGRKIHSPRVPHPQDAPVLDIDDIVVLHFQYVVWDRMLSKQRWYQAWEFSKHKAKSPLQIFREYNHMHGGWKDAEIQAVREEWIDQYDCMGAGFRELKREPVTWWDKEVLSMLRDLGPTYFRKVAIWDENWNEVAARAGLADCNFADPRTPVERYIHTILQRTQRNRGSLGTRIFEKILRSYGW